MSDNFSETTRNFAWLFWMWVSITGAGCGLWLAWRGRDIQQKQWETQNKSHLQERCEKAADMLGNEVELTRIAACRSLMNLGIGEESMKSQCVRLLFAFINNPYLETWEKSKYLSLVGRQKDEYLSELFPADKPLRADIQSAIDSFSAIYQHYDMAGIDNEKVELPKYFWANNKKGEISLIKANLRGAKLQGAYLWWANLREANLTEASLTEANLTGAKLQEAYLWGADLRGADLQVARLFRADLWGADLTRADLQRADLQGADLLVADLWGADLQGADMQDADISRADMRQAENLTKEQILSAIWGYDEEGDYGPPLLPKNLAQDEDVKKWLKTPAYDKRKKPEDS